MLGVSLVVVVRGGDYACCKCEFGEDMCRNRYTCKVERGRRRLCLCRNNDRHVDLLSRPFGHLLNKLITQDLIIVTLQTGSS